MKASSKQTKVRALLRDIKEAIAGTDQDFTTGKMSRTIFLLSVPMVLEMVMESVFAVVDIWFVSKLGAEAVAAVGLTESLITVVYAIAMGIGLATTSVVSRRIGEKDPDRAARAAFQSIITGTAISLLIAIPGYIYSSDLLRIMGASSNIINSLSGYTSIMLGGNIVIMLLFIINAAFRSSGDAAISMRVLWIANLINLLLDPILIFGLGPIPAMGITGAAIATTTGRGIAVLYQLYILFRGNKRIRIAAAHIRINMRLIVHILRISMGGIGQNMIATMSWIILVRIISQYGSVAIAGYTIAMRIILFAMLPSWGISNAAATLVGQNLGAGRPERAERAVHITGITNMIFLGLIGVILLMIPTSFIEIFIDNADVIKSGSTGLRIVSMGFIAYGFGMVIVNAFNGAGDTVTPTLINLFAFWIIEIPVAAFLSSRIFFNEEGVYVAIVIAESLMTLTAWIVFRRGKWKLKKV